MESASVVYCCHYRIEIYVRELKARDQDCSVVAELRNWENPRGHPNGSVIVDKPITLWLERMRWH